MLCKQFHVNTGRIDTVYLEVKRLISDSLDWDELITNP